MIEGRGILLLGQDAIIESRARPAGLNVEIGESPALPFERTLITVPGARVPFELLPAGFDLLERWDAAVPLWRYDITAESAGTAQERELTKGVIRDLRVLLHATELLLVRQNDTGQALIAAWNEELQRGDDKRLAFLRALYQVKPCLCVLPTSWLIGVRPSQRTLGRGVRIRPVNGGKPLVRVELEPGRFVKCHEGDEEKVRVHFERQQAVRSR